MFELKDFIYLFKTVDLLFYRLFHPFKTEKNAIGFSLILKAVHRNHTLKNTQELEEENKIPILFSREIHC